MGGYLLDTNVASHVIRGDRPAVGQLLVGLPISDIAISVVTEAELLFGLAKRGHPAGLSERVRQFLLRVTVLIWDRHVAATYAELRASCAARGLTLAPLDMMIAGHAVAADAELVTLDRVFLRVGDPLKTLDWSASLDQT